jgi:NAD(P)-dependent dehydrogenase (short-subunit alcohol dehydrogenase family)
MSDVPPPARPAHATEVPDLTGLRAVVTGASDGVGREIARALACAGARVVMPVRSRAKGEAVADDLRATRPGADIAVHDLDLASLASVDAFVGRMLDEGEPVDILVLNAGIVLLRDPVRHLSVDGHELHLQTNMLGHAALTAGLLPLLRARGARVAVQCSVAARTGLIRWDDLRLDRDYGAMRAYSASKVALGLFAVEFARRSDAAGWGIRIALCHPGIAMTNIGPPELRSDARLLARFSRRLMERGVFGQGAADAARPALHAVTAPDVRNGDFVVPSGAWELRGAPVRRRRLYRTLTRPEDRARVWDLVPALTGARFPDAAAPMPRDR